MRRLIVLVAVLASVVVGIAAGWTSAFWILLLAVVVWALMHAFDAEVEATARMNWVVYEDDRDDADHWSPTGGKDKR